MCLLYSPSARSCGWGSFTLYVASHFPNVSVTGVSNSASQRKYIMDQARQRGLKNVDVITADINVFEAPEPGALCATEVCLRSCGQRTHQLGGWTHGE